MKKIADLNREELKRVYKTNSKLRIILEKIMKIIKCI